MRLCAVEVIGEKGQPPNQWLNELVIEGAGESIGTMRLDKV